MKVIHTKVAIDEEVGFGSAAFAVAAMSTPIDADWWRERVASVKCLPCELAERLRGLGGHGPSSGGVDKTRAPTPTRSALYGRVGLPAAKLGPQKRAAES